VHSSDASPPAVAVALLSSTQGLHAHLKAALAEVGAHVVYDAAATQFDRAALDASGARVVVVNLDPDGDDEFAPLDALLSDDSLHVVFNEAAVSSRLQGWDQARWARHLVAKIVGAGEINPPRPAGAEAVPVRVKPQATVHEGDSSPDHHFQIEGGELAAALAADTGESLQRTRAALVTSEEPIAAELVDPHARPSARHDAPTVVLPRIELERALDAGAAPAPHEAPTLELDAGALRAATADAPPSPAEAIADIAFASDDASSGDKDLEVMSIDAVDEVEGDLAFEADTAPVDAGGGSLELDPEFLDSLNDFGLSLDDAVAAPTAPDAGGLELTDEFGEALGALSLEPLDEATPDQREQPPAGLDDLLVHLGPDDSAAPPPAAAPKGPPSPAAPAPPPPAAPKTPSRFGASLSLADDDAPLAPPPAAAPTQASKRNLDDFDFSGLTLAPLSEDEERKPVTGRATFVIDEKDRAAMALPPSEAPASGGSAAEESDAPLDFEQRGLRTPEVDPELAAELAAMARAADALPLGQPIARGIRHVWVLGASIGGPEAIAEFLGGVPASTPALFLLAQHMSADFLDLMVQQLARAITLPVRTVVDGDIAHPGDIVVVPLVERLQLAPDGRITLSQATDASPFSPSIDRVLRDAADRFGSAAGAIIFSGMAQDAIQGAVYLRERGGTIWAQDPASCVISSMVDGAQDAGVVSFTGTPLELAQEFNAEMARRTAAA
jgi:two-component system chemotaxis response regulator CheB/chemosensory pili system protein ChpB (putative protein-glutamate methylesterase)